MMLRYEDRLPGVLIVDSDPASRIAVAGAMERQGWQVWTASGGEEAVEEY